MQVAYDDCESVDERVERVSDLIRAVGAADLIVLPELWAPGYFFFSQWNSRGESVSGATVSALAAVAVESGAMLHMGSILERDDVAPEAGDVPARRGLYNTSVVLDRSGAVAATYRKIHPFGFGEGEPSLIDAGADIVTVPIGPQPAPHEVLAGLATCYDLRFPELFRQLTSQGSNMFVIPAAWPAARREHWQILGRARAIENQAFVVQANTGGTHAGVELGGHSQIIAPTGQVLAQAGAGEEVLAVDIDLAELHEYRRIFPVLADRKL